MGWKYCTTITIGLILIILSSMYGYNQGAKAECPNGAMDVDNYCDSHMGGIAGAIIVIATWVFILFMGIVIYAVMSGVGKV